jgi:hypothetical protein
MDSMYHIPTYEKDTTSMKQQSTLKELNELKEYCLKQNSFNPAKGSPNLFMSKLEFRIKNYYLEMELEKDSFSLYQK